MPTENGKGKANAGEGALQKQEAPEPNHAERFTAIVMQQFGGNIGEVALTEHQKRLVQGYFIAIDRALKTAEEARLAKNSSNKNHDYDNPLPCTWANVNTLDLALDAVHYARMGLDMMQDNHLFPIPYRNKKTGKYDMTLMPGYNGIRYIADKYAVEQPAAVTIELVYSTDVFRPVKKGMGSKTETYEFEITEPFSRGEILGGFGYIEHADPARNKLIIMTMQDIMKRKPEYASAEFWGGKAKKWEGGKQVERETDGWFAEMCLKTLVREVYSAKHMPRDPRKIDDSYHHMKLREAKMAELEAMAEIDENANVIVIDTDPVPIPENTGEPSAEPDGGDNDTPPADGGEPAQMSLEPSF